MVASPHQGLGSWAERGMWLHFRNSSRFLGQVLGEVVRTQDEPARGAFPFLMDNPQGFRVPWEGGVSTGDSRVSDTTEVLRTQVRRMFLAMRGTHCCGSSPRDFNVIPRVARRQLLGTCQKHKPLGPTPDLQSDKFYGQVLSHPWSNKPT